MIHKQWRIQVVLDILNHEEADCEKYVDVANYEVRNRLNDEALAPGVNVSSITEFEPQVVKESGLRSQISVDVGAVERILRIERGESPHLVYGDSDWFALQCRDYARIARAYLNLPNA